MIRLRDNKAKAQTHHAKRKLEERYGLRLSQFIHDSLLYAIHHQGATLVKRQSHRVALYDITYQVRLADIIDDKVAHAGPTTIRVVYDKLRGNIVTALGLDMYGFDEENLS